MRRGSAISFHGALVFAAVKAVGNRRYYGHTSSFRDSVKKHNTTLSTHVWKRELNPEPEIERSILAHAPAYSKGNRNCDLCLTDKIHIARNFNDPAYLNRRSELAQRCRHKPTFLLQPPAKKGNGARGNTKHRAREGGRR